MDDARIDQRARAFRDGDLDGLRDLVEELTRPLIAMARRYVGNWESARDLTQDTWLRVHRSIGQWDPSRPFRPWVFGIHRNLCLDHLRTRRPEVVDERVLEEMPASGMDPLSATLNREFRDRIRDALEGLSAVQKQVLTMVDLEELAPSEVATAMGMKPATVRTTLHFARRKLARLLGSEDQ
jgi:RNA polymerase sigma-70 factor (ECF subfamily)